MAIAGRLLRDGDRVIAMSRTRSAGFLALQEEFSGRLQWEEVDFGDPALDAADRFGEWNEAGTVLHGFVNNAAMAYDDLVSNLRLEPLEHLFRVNTLAPMLLTRAVLRNFLLHETAGSIVHVSSICCHTGYKGMAMYAATKGALEAFSRNTAREWGSRGIRSNCVVPGFMETDMTAGMEPEVKAKIYRRTALQRPVDLDSVAATVAFLLSEAGHSMTGQNLFVDSGAI